MLRKALLLPALLLLAPPPASAQAPRPAEGALPKGIARVTSVEGVTEYRLANGLKILMIPDRSIDTITVNVTYLVGSRQEGYGETGMAHLLEHLMFRGTRRFPDIKADFQQRGARFNGSTAYDRTNEFESGENSAFNVLRERVAASAYLWHNYGRAIIGARSDIENVPIERLQAFYRQYYQPDNAVVLVSGKLDESTALGLVQKHFGGISKPSRRLRGTYTVEPTQDGERTVTLRRSGDVQLVSALYHMPPGTHPEYAAVDVLVALVNHVPSGRLHKALVDTGLASSVFGTERQQREAGFAYFGATLRQDASLEAARDALLGVLEGFARNPVTEDEVERARTRLLNDIELTLADSRELTGALSEYVGIGDWRVLFLHRDRLERITADDVQAVALHYLKPANRTLGICLACGWRA